MTGARVVPGRLDIGMTSDSLPRAADADYLTGALERILLAVDDLGCRDLLS
jgi:hypothetical protein